MSYNYFDYSAATPVDPKVLKEMEAFQSKHFANPSSLHRLGKEMRENLEDSRKRIAKILGAKSAEIIFTSGSTESTRIAIEGVSKQFPAGRVMISSIEHEATRSIFDHLEATGRMGTVVTVDESGLINPHLLQATLNDSTVLVCVQYANHEIGTIQPISKISQIIESVRKDRASRGITLPIYLYVDAAQAALLSLSVDRLGVDLMSLSANKFYGPVGVGALYIRTGVEIAAINSAGGQESGLRGGTENVVGALGMAAALELTQRSRASETKRLEDLRNHLWKELHEKLDGISLNGSIKNRLPGNLNICIDGAAGETMVAYLDKEGFGVSTGSACTAANEDPSKVLLSIGLSRHQAESSLRISMGGYTIKKDVSGLIKALVKVTPRVRELTKKA